MLRAGWLSEADASALQQLERNIRAIGDLTAAVPTGWRFPLGYDAEAARSALAQVLAGLESEVGVDTLVRGLPGLRAKQRAQWLEASGASGRWVRKGGEGGEIAGERGMQAPRPIPPPWWQQTSTAEQEDREVQTTQSVGTGTIELVKQQLVARQLEPHDCHVDQCSQVAAAVGAPFGEVQAAVRELRASGWDPRRAHAANGNGHAPPATPTEKPAAAAGAVEKAAAAGSLKERFAAAVDRYQIDLTKVVPGAVQAELAEELGTTANTLSVYIKDLRRARGIQVSAEAIQEQRRTARMTAPAPESPAAADTPHIAEPPPVAPVPAVAEVAPAPPAVEGPARPTVVCLCGSTRFWRTFQELGLQETLAGRIVLSIGAARAADDDDRTFGGYTPAAEYDAVKDQLDELHKRKIDLADEILVLDVGGYVGPSTRSEIEYAQAAGKPVRWLSQELPGYQEHSPQPGVPEDPTTAVPPQLTDDERRLALDVASLDTVRLSEDGADLLRELPVAKLARVLSLAAALVGLAAEWA